MKPKNQYWEEAAALRRLYEERCPPGMSQEQFGAEFGIGTQGMVSQYLTGNRPLNYDAAAKFARGLRCTIYDISPTMAAELETAILPVLGRKARKVAMLAALAILAGLEPQTGHAAIEHNSDFASGTNAHCVRRRILAWLRHWLFAKSMRRMVQPGFAY